MKKNNPLQLIIILLIFFSSCTDEENILDPINDTVALSTRSTSLIENSKSNPNLQNGWENADIIILNNGGLKVDPPWIDIEGHSVDIPDNYRNDIKKEDGWELLFHTLIDSDKSDPNYIIFYNKYTGVLKGFYYNPSAVPNNNFIWVMETNAPTSIFYQNEYWQEPLNAKKFSKAMTTSNIANSSITNFGQLNLGWNCFAFELPYGNIDNKPIISIRGYSNNQSDFSGEGSYAGQVVIPIPKSSNQLEEITGGISKVIGSISKIIPKAKLTIPKEGASILSTIFGQSILSLNKDETVSIYAKSSGVINLTGSINSPVGGYITPLLNIDIRKSNGDKELGLWNLRERPVINYGKYSEAYEEYDDYGNKKNNEFKVYVNCHTSIDRNDIVVNPLLLGEIESYHAFSVGTFLKKKNKESSVPYMYLYGNHLTDDVFEVRNTFLRYAGYNWSGNKMKQLFFFTEANNFRLHNLYVTVCFNVKYKNGKEVNSYRNFQAATSIYDNYSSLIDRYKRPENEIVMIN